MGDDFLWRLFDRRYLSNLLVLRETLDTPFTMNTPTESRRGLRLARKGKTSLSGHYFGKAGDTLFKYTAESIRQAMKEGCIKVPYPCRLERLKNGKPITWLHMDVHEVGQNEDVIFFNV